MPADRRMPSSTGGTLQKGPVQWADVLPACWMETQSGLSRLAVVRRCITVFEKADGSGIMEDSWNNRRGLDTALLA
jgi:hypothetical protein